MITLFCAKTQEIENIKNLFVFDYFKTKGYTTATAFTQFDDLIKNKVTKIKAEQVDCIHFYSILKGIKSKKHYQTKLGTDNIFIELITEKSIIKAVICSSELILDLTNNKEYWIKDKEQQKWLIEFLSKIKNSCK